MNAAWAKARKVYETIFLRCTSKMQQGFLLLVRLYWGWGFFVAGKGKVMNLKATADTFEMWEIPMPGLNALLAGTIESLFGLTLLVGLASRVSAVPLIGVMIVAYLTAHREDLSSLNAFVGAPPFTYLFACLIVFLYGPGLFSVDRLLGRKFGCGCDTQCATAPPAAASAE